MPNYENETCEGCRYYREKLGETRRHEACVDAEMSRESGWPDLRDRCDRFTPSLECRKVRALERLAARPVVIPHPGQSHVILGDGEG